jgi:hypothetical protein
MTEREEFEKLARRVERITDLYANLVAELMVENKRLRDRLRKTEENRLRHAEENRLIRAIEDSDG